MKKEYRAQMLVLHTVAIIGLFGIRNKELYEWALLAVNVFLYGFNLYHLAKDEGGNDDESKKT